MINQKTCHKIIDNIQDGLYFVDLNRVITFWSKAAEHITGFSAEEVMGRPCFDNILTHVDSQGISLCNGNCPLEATMHDGEGREAELVLHHKSGHRVPVSVRTNTLTDQNNTIIGGLELFTDISSHIAAKERISELKKLALLDKLTHLANRHYITSEIGTCFEEMKRFNMSFGILFMDVDNFKSFNDTYGHDVGDSMLKLIAKTLASNSRPYDLFGRWGGEEFVGIIRNIGNKNLERLANRARFLVESSYKMINKKRLHATISVGATLAIDNDTIESLFSRADTAMYKSKDTGRNRVTFV